MKLHCIQSPLTLTVDSGTELGTISGRTSDNWKASMEIKCELCLDHSNMSIKFQASTIK